MSILERGAARATALGGAVGHLRSAVGASAGGGWHPDADPGAVTAFLRDVGVDCGGGSPAELESAVRRFQAAAGLAVDGVPGPDTVHVLARTRHAVLEARAAGGRVDEAAADPV